MPHSWQAPPRHKREPKKAHTTDDRAHIKCDSRTEEGGAIEDTPTHTHTHARTDTPTHACSVPVWCAALGDSLMVLAVVAKMVARE